MTGVFIHIPKTGGVSIQEALGLQQYRSRKALVRGTRYEGLVTFGHSLLDRLIHNGFLDPVGMFLFAFVRNPYDRAVSLWAHWQRERPGRDLEFPYWCRRLEEWHFRIRTPQARWLDGIDVGFVGRFERLDDDFNKLCDRLDIERRPLPHLNKGDREACSAYYDSEAQAIVRAHYARDFEAFGYADDHLPD